MNAFRKSARRVLGVALLFLFSGAASAVTTAGAASSIVLPVAAKTSSFETEVFVFNHNAYAINVDVLYFEANGLTAPGQKTCSVLSLAAGETKSFKLGTQCPALDDGASHFGLMVLRDRSSEKVNTFYGYSRVQHVSFLQGFSVEGFPEHVFSGSVATSTGLKRNGPPADFGSYQYTTNCFVGSLADPVDYLIQLYDAAGVKVGNDVTGSLGPYQLVRQFDIFKQAGIPDGQQLENVRATFDETNNASSADEPAFIGFCTVQDNIRLGADFRVAKSIDAANLTQRKFRCRGTSDAACTVLTSPATYSIPNAATMQRWSMFIHHPDRLKCTIVGPDSSKLEMRLLAPAAPGVPGVLKAGGNNVSEFYYETGGRQAAFGDGTQQFWTLDVSAREGIPFLTFPIAYGLRCYSGSGIHLSGAPSDSSPDPF